jgi:hypothetical protein
MQQLESIRLGPFGKRRILDAETDQVPILVNVSVFTNLKVLELYKLSPMVVSGWHDLQQRLVSITVKGGLLTGPEMLLVECVLADVRRDAIDLEESVDHSMPSIAEEESSMMNSIGDLSAPMFLPPDKQFTDLSPDEVWPKLLRLNLTSNAFKAIAPHAFIHCAKTLEHLDLTHNHLRSVPHALMDLYRLRSVDLSYNDIDSVDGIGEILGSVKHVALRANKLEDTKGMDRLWAMEYLDVRDNHIGKIKAFTRMSQLPFLREMLIDGNEAANKVCTISWS